MHGIILHEKKRNRGTEGQPFRKELLYLAVSRKQGLEYCSCQKEEATYSSILLTPSLLQTVFSLCVSNFLDGFFEYTQGNSHFLVGFEEHIGK